MRGHFHTQNPNSQRYTLLIVWYFLLHAFLCFVLLPKGDNTAWVVYNLLLLLWKTQLNEVQIAPVLATLAQSLVDTCMAFCNAHLFLMFTGVPLNIRSDLERHALLGLTLLAKFIPRSYQTIANGFSFSWTFNFLVATKAAN